jgi:hypothetical protein
MAKKPANKASKTMTKKGMKKTKGGLIGLLKPATISGNTITGNTLNGDNKLNGDVNGITGNTITI